MNTNTNATLIPTFTGTLGNQPQPLVNARDLHEFLGVESRFNDWIKKRIAEYDFIEDEEFYSEISKTSNGLFGGRPKTEYHLSLDMAKELSMVERNDKGRQARRYFINCEKTLHNQPSNQTLNQSQHTQHLNHLKSLLLKHNHTWQRLAIMYNAGLTNAEMAGAIAMSTSFVEKQLRIMRTADIISGRGTAHPQAKQLCMEV